MIAVPNCIQSILIFIAVATVVEVNGGWYRIVGPKTVYQAVNVGAGIHFVTFSNVIFSGTAATVEIDLGAMMTFPGSTPPKGEEKITIQFCACTFTNGATVHFKGRSYQATASNSKQMSLVILDLVISNGGIAFSGEMPYKSTISLVTPLFRYSGGPTPYYGATLGSVATCVLFSGFTQRQGTFLLYALGGLNDPPTFVGSTGSGITMKGGFNILEGCVLLLDYIISTLTSSSVVDGGAATITIGTSSVFYIRYLDATGCSVCLSFGTMYLSGGILLIKQPSFSRSGTSIRVSNTQINGAGWFAIMSGTFASSPVSGGALSGYASIVGNMFDSGTGSISSSGYQMCNFDSSGSPIYPGGSSAYGCDQDSLFNDGITWPRCYGYGGHMDSSSGIPTCVCTAARADPDSYCIPFDAPRVSTVCLHTDTVTKRITLTSTITLRESATRKQPSESYSETRTEEMSISASASALSGSIENSLTMTAELTMSFTLTLSRTISANSATYNLSTSIWLTPTQVSLTLSVTNSLSLSSTMSLSSSLSDESSATDSATPTSTLIASPSDSITMTSPSETVSRSKTISLTSSSCEWFPDWFPLRMHGEAPTEKVSNDTYYIHYYDFRYNGSQFTFEDLGQWYVIDFALVSEIGALNVVMKKGDGTVFVQNIFNVTTTTFLITTVAGFNRSFFYNSELQRTISIQVVFRCAVVNRTQYYEIVVLPSPPKLSAAATELWIRSSMLASVVLATPYGSSIAALALNLQQLYLCQPLTETTQFDVFRWRLGSDSMALMRGAIVGNFLAVAGQLALMMLVTATAVYWNRRIGDLTMSEDFWRILRVLQLPTSLHISASAVLQLIIAASISLLRTSKDAPDIVLGAFGVLICLGYVGLICQRAVKIYVERRGSFSFESLSLPIRVLPREEDEFVYGEFDKPWYAAAETLIFLFIGVISGSPTAEPYLCTPQFYSVAFVSLVSCIILIYFRPMKTNELFAFALFIRVFTLVMCGLAVWMSTTYSLTDQPLAMQGASVCIFLLALMALCRALWDLRRLYHSAPALFRAIYRLKDPEPIPEPDHLSDDDSYPSPQPICVSSSSSEEEFVPRENLKETDVIGFLGQAKDEVEDVDELLMAYRHKKPSKPVDLERVLDGQGRTSPPSASDDDDDDDDVRRVVKKGMMTFDVPDRDDDDVAPMANPFHEIEGEETEYETEEEEEEEDRAL